MSATLKHRPPRDMDDVMAYNANGGGHWFDPDTVRFFGTRVCGILRGGRYFVTSERDRGPNPAWNGERRYTVREVFYRPFIRPDGRQVDYCDIGTVSDDDISGFGAYRSARAADRAITALLEREA